jgi:hypothetical protein
MLVRVKNYNEIRQSLDKDDSLYGLQFTHEMKKYCGTTQRILTEVTRVKSDGRGYEKNIGILENVYMLDNVFCNGERHLNCTRQCKLLWHKNWLDFKNSSKTVEPLSNKSPLLIDDPTLCQASTIMNAATHFSNKFYHNLLNREYFSKVSVSGVIKDILNGVSYIITTYIWSRKGSLRRTPSVSLGLKVGDRVRVRSFEEIKRTLDVYGRNRGLGFSAEMRKYCGQTLTVSYIMRNVISEYTGELKQASNTVLLDGSICDGEYHSRCQRQCPHMWREIWLERPN